MKNKIICVAALSSGFTALAYAGCDTPNYLTDTYFEIGAGKSFIANKTSTLIEPGDNVDSSLYFKKKLKNANIYKASIGKKIESFRVELEYIHSDKYKFNGNYTSIIDDESKTLNHKYNIKHNTFFVNGFMDFNDQFENVVPYIGAGLGISKNRLSTENVSYLEEIKYSFPKKSKTSFAWNVGAGVIYNVNENTYLNLNYKYTDLGKLAGNSSYTITEDKETFNTPKNVKGNLKSNVVTLSVGFKF